MRRLSALVLVMAACSGGIVVEEVGPPLGLWQLDATERWFCSRFGSGVCLPPAYFSPLPEQVEIRGGGVLSWTVGVEHDGTVEATCIRVLAASEGGVRRAETTFCNLVENGVVNQTRAFAIIGWSPGTPDECTCSAHFDFTGA